jgi:serine/threonine protein kinase
MHTKVVSEKELTITAVASELGVGAELLCSERLENGKHSISLRKYPFTLYKLYQKQRYVEYNTYLLQARELLQKLHAAGVFQGDISEENALAGSGYADNIMCDPTTHEVRVIDFGMSYFTCDVLQPINIEHYQELYYEGVKYAGEPSATFDYLCRLELGCLEFLRYQQ